MALSLRAGRKTGRLPNDPWPQWSYFGFGQFRRRLVRHLGIDLEQMQLFGGDQDWATVSSPLRHLLGHVDDRGELTPDQAAELAPALRDALAEIGKTIDPGDIAWDYDQRNGTELVLLLELCAAEDVPLEFG